MKVKRVLRRGARFLPVVDLWAAGVQDALQSDQLILQRGQWVICGDRKRKSRFVGMMGGGTILVCHPTGIKGGAGKGAFITRCGVMDRVMSQS